MQNILFLLSDQHRFDALGCNGNTVCQTPELDKLAADGVCFSNAYTCLSLCSPARGSLLTGLYPHIHGQLANTGNFNSVFDRNILDKKGYPQHLKKAGYNTGYTGKWHLPKERDCDFWHFDRWPDSRPTKPGYEYGKDEVQRIEWGGSAPFCGVSTLKTEETQEYAVATETIQLVREFGDQDKPFMICSGFFGPHFPQVVPQEYFDTIDPNEIEKWINFEETFENKPRMQQLEQLRWNSSHLTWPDWQKVIATYYAYCRLIDDQIKRIIDLLKQRGLYDNTIIVYSTDHGDMTGSHRLFNKGFHMYEETHHIPLIIRNPASNTRGTVCSEFVNTVDIMPTFLDIAGVQEDDDTRILPGRSLLPLTRGETPTDWPQEAYSQFHGYEGTLCTVRMIRNKKWKYVYCPTGGDELYDLESDPGELTNLANRIGFKHVLRRMKEKMVDWLCKTDDGIVDQNSWQSQSYDLLISDREK